jgi:hypothetical protein
VPAAPASVATVQGSRYQAASSRETCAQPAVTLPDASRSLTGPLAMKASGPDLSAAGHRSMGKMMGRNGLGENQ